MITTTANDIELKFTDKDLPLVFEYIGPNRTHGDGYYEKRFVWIECISETENIVTDRTLLGIICLTQENLLKGSLHLSVLETFIKGKGHGSIIMNSLIKLATYLKYSCITLQAHTPENINFYKKFGFTEDQLNRCPLMKKML